MWFNQGRIGLSAVVLVLDLLSTVQGVTPADTQNDTSTSIYSLGIYTPSSFLHSLVNDLKLAFSPSTPPPPHPNPQGRSPSAPTTPANTHQGLIFARQEGDSNQAVLETKCRVRETRLKPGENGTLPVPPIIGPGNHTVSGTGTATSFTPLPTESIGEGHGGGGEEVIAVTTPCGDIPVGATVNTEPTTGPNGSIEWLTCGIDPNDMYNSTWQPPYATIDQIITVEGGLPAALHMPNSPYAACDRYVDLFEAAGAEFNIPPLFLAAFALQESGCNPAIEGQGGEQGMMQLSMDKCDNAPDGDCLDPWYNVRTAAAFFRGVLNGNNGNVIESVGLYNGWFRGMNFYEATTWGIYHNCCRCQRNLDYLHQFFNGWLLGRPAWSDPRLGSFFNVDICNEV